MTLVSVDLGMTEERIQELEQPVTDEQFQWLEQRGLLDNGKTYEENRSEWVEPDSVDRTLWKMTGETKAARFHPGYQHNYRGGKCELRGCGHLEEPKGGPLTRR